MKLRVPEISRKLRAYALLLVAAMVSVLFVSAPSQAAAGINGQINFQGRLLTPQGATVADGYYNVQFKIYQDGDGQTAGNITGSPAGTLKWTESHLNANSQGVVVKNGYLSVQLGSVTPFGSSVDWNQDTLWLSINIAGTNATCTPFTSCTPDGEMLPMKRLSSTPYAMNAGRLGGLTSSQFIQSTTVPQAANIAVQSAAANSIGAQVMGAAAQTADIFQIKANGVSTSLFAVSAAGAASLQNSTDSSAAFTVSNSAGRLVLGVDTAGGKVTIGNITSTAGAGVAGKLVLADGTNDNFGSTVNTAVLSADRTITLPDESGTVCIQTSTNCGFLTGSASSYIQNQNAAQQASSNFWISGTGRVDTAIQAPTIDTATASALNLGTTNATGINLNQSTTLASGKNLVFASGSFAATFSTAALSANRSITIPNAGGTLAVSASGNIALSAAGDISFTGTLPVLNGGTGSTTAGGARTNLGAAASGVNNDITSLSGLTTALSLGQGGTSATTAQGAINNISGLTTNGDLLYNNGTNSTRLARGSNGQCLVSDPTTILWGSCLTTEADTLASVTARGATTSTAVVLQGGATVRGVTVDTATATDDKIAVSVTSGGTQSFTGTLSSNDLTAARTWNLPDASGTICMQGSTSCGFLTTSNGVQLQASTPGTAQSGNFNISGTGIAGVLQSNSMSVLGSAGTANITVGTASTNTGQITFVNSSTAQTAIIQSGATSASYTTVLPTAVGVAGQCLSVGSVVGSTQSLGYVGCLTSANSIELQATTPGTAQTGNFNINGTGIVGTMQTSLVAAADDASITVRGGNATVANTNGGDITVTGGAGNGTGVTGLVNLGPTAYTTVTNASCAANCTISQANVDNYGTIVISATTSDINITLPPPTNTLTKGRTVYVTTASTSTDFTLVTNSGADLIEVAMRKNTTSTMIWSGTAWTPGGASNATTLQATYNNGSNPATTPEIKLDSIRGTIDIQDADTTIGSDILNVRGSNASGLGTVLFGVSNTGRVTIQGTTDDSSAFRVLNASGDYLFNINSSNNYVISNSIRSAGNEISNPGFESGGLITGGEEGWFGPATASIAENNVNARTGNNALAITASSANIDVFAGSYYEINAGDSLFAAGWVKNTAGATGNAGIQITWYDKNKAVISNSTAYSSTPGTSYIQRNVGSTAPAGTVYARVSATIRSSATTGTFYFDDFYMKRNLETADMTFRNISNSTTGFRIQSANAGNTLFTADTAGNAVRIGDNTGSGTDTTVLVVDSATADPTALTGLNGGIFYRSDSGTLKAIVGGAVVDVCTTAVTCTGYSASAGSTIQLQATSPGTAQAGNFNITGTGILTKLQTQDNASGSSQALTVKTGNAGAGNSGNLIIDTGTATGTRGAITIGTGAVAVTMEGSLNIQGSNTLALGQSTANTGSILFRSAAGSNTVTLRGPTSAGSSYTLTLPSALGATGECIKINATGDMFFQGCGVGVAFNLQDAYNNSGTPADITLTDGKNFQITAADTSTADPSIVFKLNCTTGCTGTNGRFIVQNSTTDVLSVLPNGNIVLNGPVDIGSGDTSDSTATLFQMDNYAGSTDNGTINCTQTTNAGALYYNSTMGSIRGCINGSWNDISNPDTLGLLTFGIVPSSGSHPYDLPSLITAGYTGPCRASWAGQFKIHVEPCTAYSNGRRVTVVAEDLYTTTAARTAAGDTTAPAIDLTTAKPWGHICLDPTTGQPKFTAADGDGAAAGTQEMPSFSAAQPILCIADVKGSATTAGAIDDLYDVRTFTSAMKEAVTTSTAVELGMMADSAGSSVAPSAACSSGTCSGKLYGLVVATNGTTSSTEPNTIVTSVGPGFVKSISGNAGEFAKASTTTGYATTISAIPNNAFYFSPGNARTSFSTTCTATNNCNSSMYVNFIVR